MPEDSQVRRLVYRRKFQFVASLLFDIVLCDWLFMMNDTDFMDYANYNTYYRTG